MHKNKEMGEKVHNYVMHDMGFAKDALTVKEDELGNIIGVDKYYPKLKVIK